MTCSQFWCLSCDSEPTRGAFAWYFPHLAIGVVAEVYLKVFPKGCPGFKFSLLLGPAGSEVRRVNTSSKDFCKILL